VSEWRVALTIDVEHPDRPHRPGTTDRLLDALDVAGVPATLFLQGRWCEAYPEVAWRIGISGHLVGHHSQYHVRFPLLNDAGIATDLGDAEAAIRETSGVDPAPWFRLPFGAGADDARVLAAVSVAGYRHIGWDVDGMDWEVGRTAAALEDDIVGQTLARGDGAVVMVHGWPDPTATALPGFVARLRDAGATFVRIDALADRPIAHVG
jgi:peptidoglycan/xylan/chitin deacetylase (PgdA/CDA1 family)